MSAKCNTRPTTVNRHWGSCMEIIVTSPEVRAAVPLLLLTQQHRGPAPRRQAISAFVRCIALLVVHSERWLGDVRKEPPGRSDKDSYGWSSLSGCIEHSLKPWLLVQGHSTRCLSGHRWYSSTGMPCCCGSHVNETVAFT